jgi:hypothetical protein
LPASLQLPDDDIAAHRNPDGLDRSIDARGLAVLRAWFAEDYQFMSLCRKLMFEEGRGE